MADFTRLNGYDVKDKISREDLEKIKNAIAPRTLDDISITDEINSSSTDDEIVTAKSVYDYVQRIVIGNYYLTFNVTPSDATIVVKDSNDNVITPDANNRYVVTNGTYTYTITKEGYTTITNSVTINNSDSNITITMEEITNFYLTFNVTPSDATIVVKDNNDNVVNPDTNNRYVVVNGTYTYTITKEGYITITDNVIINNNDESITITMTLDNRLFLKVLQAHGGANTIEAKGTPDFSQTATTDEGMYMANDDLGKSYYFRGTAPDNYVSFAGKTWRIVRINGDNSVRLISADTPITDQTYNSSRNNNAYVGYKYTLGEVHGLGTDSNAKTQLETWYTNNLESYDSYIADQIFINDRRPFTDEQGTTSGGGTGTTHTYYAPFVRNYTNKAPILTTNVSEDRFSVGSSVGSVTTNASCSKKIGMLTYDEVCMAGGVNGTSNTSYYLNNNTNWWGGSPNDVNINGLANVVNVASTGSVGGGGVNDTRGLRPVISLKSTVEIASGTGTSSDPYVLTL